MRTDLGPDDMADLLDQPLIAVLATRRADDTILLSPVWFEWRDRGFNVWADSATNGKVRHLLRDPRATIVVSSTDEPYRGLEVRGSATVDQDPAAFYAVLGRTATRYYGAERGARMVAGYTTPGVVIRLEPGNVRTWDYGDEG
jgi:PPOX class probable F420-dependent enzyme